MKDDTGFSFKDFTTLEKMFPNGFLIMHANSDGMVQYARFNPRRIECIELWEKWIVEFAEAHGPNFWKGFINKDEIPDFFPDEWNNTSGGLEDVDLPPNND